MGKWAAWVIVEVACGSAPPAPQQPPFTACNNAACLRAAMHDCDGYRPVPPAVHGDIAQQHDHGDGPHLLELPAWLGVSWLASVDFGVGTIEGVIFDERGVALPGVTVIATSPALTGAQTAITDERGTYEVRDVPAGEYSVTFYYADITIARRGLHVDAGAITDVAPQRMDTAHLTPTTDTQPTVQPALLRPRCRWATR